MSATFFYSEKISMAEAPPPGRPGAPLAGGRQSEADTAQKWTTKPELTVIMVEAGMTMVPPAPTVALLMVLSVP